MKESSSNKEEQICLKASYKADNIPGIKPFNARLFKMSIQLVEENYKLREHILGLKESLKYLKEKI